MQRHHIQARSRAHLDDTMAENGGEAPPTLGQQSSTEVCLARTTNGTAAAMQWRPGWGMSCYSTSEEVLDVKAAAAWWTSNNRNGVETGEYLPSSAQHSGATEGPPGGCSTRDSDCMPELALSSEDITDKGGAIGSPPSAPQPLDRVRGEVAAAWAQSQHTSGQREREKFYYK